MQLNKYGFHLQGAVTYVLIECLVFSLVTDFILDCFESLISKPFIVSTRPQTRVENTASCIYQNDKGI